MINNVIIIRQLDNIIQNASILENSQLVARSVHNRSRRQIRGREIDWISIAGQVPT